MEARTILDTIKVEQKKANKKTGRKLEWLISGEAYILREIKKDVWPILCSALIGFRNFSVLMLGSDTISDWKITLCR